VDATVNIHKPLTAPLCFGTPPKMDSSNYTINSTWLPEQQAAQICNLVASTKGILLLCSTKQENTTGARYSSLHFFTTITTQNTLIKWKSDFWMYTTRHVGRAR